jgi:hypothetical protein
MMRITKAKRSIVIGVLLLLTQLTVFAQDAAPENSAPRQNSPLGRLEVPDSEEQRRFVKEHSFNNPGFRQRQLERADAEAAPSAAAAKQVRVIYLVPSDKSVRADYQGAIANAISDLQGFYQNQMGGYTFALHAPSVEVYQTTHATAFYTTGFNSRPGGFYESVLADGFALTGGGFDDPNNRWIFYVDVDIACGQYTGGTNGIAVLPANDLRGLTSQPTVPTCPSDHPSSLSINRWIGGLGHELGHALGLPHPPGCDNGNCAGGPHAYNSLMYVGYASYPNTHLLDENKSILLAGGFFGPLTYGIGGLITGSDNTPLAGATVTLSETQASVASDANGRFSFTGLSAGGNYTVSVSKAGYGFTPASAVFINLGQNQTANFTGHPDTHAFQFSAASYQAGEADGHVAIQVTRSGSAAQAVVDYSTSDSSGLNSCSGVTGMASSRCDYATTVGTLRFAAGETSRTISIPLVDDGLAEGAESLTISLSDPAAASGPGAITTATITITDNDAVSGANPLDQTPFFVRQHYIDFLGREPDPAGLQGWQNVLNNCAPGNIQCDRVEVSSAFFRSPEFQDRAYFIYRFYSAVGRIPVYDEFMPDFAKVSGFLSAEQLEANKVAFINEFMTRPDFQNKYGALADPTTYVNALLQTVGLPNHPSRQAWIAGLTNGSLSRAQVLRALVESPEVYQKYYTEAFVIMQYFGYLRRSADISYEQWIVTMNNSGGDYRLMINGFLNSPEYRQRFGP